MDGFFYFLNINAYDNRSTERSESQIRGFEEVSLTTIVRF
jgi:hypothetical protein